MEYNANLHKLVNATNILFHMMDIQPYAMVLPMDKTSSVRNKRKILHKMFNNTQGIDKPRSREDSKTQANITEASLNNSHANISKDKKYELRNGTRAESKLSNSYSGSLEQSNPKTSIDGVHQSNPVTSPTGGIENHTSSFVDTKIDEKYIPVSRVIERLDNDYIVGCMIILAKKGSNKKGIVPIAGGIIEVFDEYERSIQAIWRNSGLENETILMHALVLRLFAHAYQMSIPYAKRVQQKSKLVTIYHTMGTVFPESAYGFIKDDMGLSKHCEVLKGPIQHNDNPKVPCKCLKFETSLTMFHGITEYRFVALYTTVYERVLTHHMSVLSRSTLPKGYESVPEKDEGYSKPYRDTYREIRTKREEDNRVKKYKVDE
ncbi:conserved hypothetical protein [Theileria equi strain WA]|uniref:Uncharacterized protein n=1 Tax=Theileria equi strain WA TaxID=1537102 RepID=L1LD70_THEEQ|nr:conserved hypothetical protein [Theileria equi strain WA]EKX73123.1 conserved hypothetical protein [Theileria equi strain WA]|eukprot:XP_004832575.1 conserved hypothetical protein [Theileria equi strain WA]